MVTVRPLRFFGRHLLLLNLLLCAMVWLLYGGFELRGYGEQYLARTGDFWLDNGWPRVPGLENVLLPGLAALFAAGWTAAGFEFTAGVFIVLAAAPYALFIYGLTAYVRRRRHGRLLAVGAALSLYTSGMIPYMTSWGGSVDGLTYLALLPVVIWPNSLAIFAVSALLQCLNHYIGLVGLLLFAFVWHTAQALDLAQPRERMRWWLAAFVPRAAIAGVMLIGFIWFWEARFPEVAGVRQTIVGEKWSRPEALLLEVLGPFPWTWLSPLKLAAVPIVVLMLAPHPRRALRAAALAVPLVAAVAMTFVFVDITRIATILVIGSWFVMLRAAAGDLDMPHRWRRRLRRTLLATAVLNLFIPNYYVNNGEIHVPPSVAIRWIITGSVEE
jgi:hypothetical protein